MYYSRTVFSQNVRFESHSSEFSRFVKIFESAARVFELKQSPMTIIPMEERFKEKQSSSVCLTSLCITAQLENQMNRYFGSDVASSGFHF